VQHGEDEDDALPGQDSFIDVVCNMVGILIVLVMIVGVRATGANSPTAKSAPISATAASAVPQSADSEVIRKLQEAKERAGHAKREIEDAAGQMIDLETQSILVEARRQELSLVKAAVEQDIQERRSKLSEEGQKKFDVQREIAESEIKLHQLMQEQVSLVSASPEVEKIECVPTPIAKEVTGEEIHVRLRHGLLAVLPTEELLAEVERRGVDYIRNGLNHRNQAEEVYGPIDGFRMRFFVARREEEAVPGAPRATMPAPSRIFLKFTFTAVSDQVGQPVEQAMLPDSKFMRTLRTKRTANPAVIAWVYADSYAELRTLKREIWKAGLPLGVRPVVGDQPIVFVTGGSRAVAQ
jgi:hypothetical protein